MPSNIVWGGGAFVVMIGIWLTVQMMGAAKPPAPEPVPPAPVADAAPAEFDDGLPDINPLGSDIKILERKVLMPRETFDSQTTLYEEPELMGQPSLAYQIRVPSNWTKIQGADFRTLQITGGLQDTLAYYRSPSTLELYSTIKIKAEPVKYMQSAASWLRGFAARQSYTFQAFADRSYDRAETEFLITANDVTSVVRMTAIINGPWVVTAEYAVPVDHYMDQKDVQIWTMASFYLKYIDERATEKTNVFTDIPGAPFSVPASWTMYEQNIAADTQSTFTFIHIGESSDKVNKPLLGRIDVTLFNTLAQHTPDTRLDVLNTKLSSLGVRLGDKIAHFQIPHVPDGALAPEGDVYQMKTMDGQDRNDQYWVIHFPHGAYTVSVGLLSQPSTGTYDIWAKNFGAFAWIVRSMKTGH